MLSDIGWLCVGSREAETEGVLGFEEVYVKSLLVDVKLSPAVLVILMSQLNPFQPFLHAQQFGKYSPELKASVLVRLHSLAMFEHLVRSQIVQLIFALHDWSATRHLPVFHRCAQPFPLWVPWGMVRAQGQNPWLKL